MTKKNGKIELMRFFFTIFIVLFHINLQTWNLEKGFTEHISFWSHGTIGVEFFFLVSGFLLAKHVARRRENDSSSALPDYDALGQDTVRFLWGKIRGLLPYHIPFCVVMFVLCALKGTSLSVLLLSIPSLLFMNRTGFVTGNNLLGTEWYISSMLMAMAVLYPLLRRYGKTFSCVIAPFIGIILMGWINNSFQAISKSSSWNGILFICNLRAIGELCLGLACYEVCSALQKVEFSHKQRVLISVIEFLCYALSFCYIISFAGRELEIMILMLFCVAVTLSFSQKGIFGKSPLFQNKICSFLGGVSLPIYLIQNIFLYAVPRFGTPQVPKWQAVWIFVLTVVFGILSYAVYNFVQNRRRNR